MIYDSRKSGCVLFRGGLAFLVTGKLENIAALWDRSALYVCDSRAPVAHSAFALVVTSPQKENWSTFAQSPDVSVLVLPMFELDEMLRLRQVAFADKAGCSEAEVREGYTLWGGSPRNVLTKAADAVWLKRLATAGGALTVDTLTRSVSTSTALDGAASNALCNRVVNLVPMGALEGSALLPSDPRYYEFDHAELVSDHVIGIFADHLEYSDQEALLSLMSKLSTDPAIAGLVGVMYERAIVVPRLRNGGNALSALRLRRLSPALSGGFPRPLRGDTVDWSAALPLVQFKSIDELQRKWRSHEGDAMFVPISKCFPVADLVLRKGVCVLLLNTTIAERHDVAAGNVKFCQMLDAVGLGEGSTKEISLLWVLPVAAFERFDTAGTLKGDYGGELVAGPAARHAVGKRIVQYTVELPVPLTAAAAAAAASRSRDAEPHRLPRARPIRETTPFGTDDPPRPHGPVAEVAARPGRLQRGSGNEWSRPLVRALSPGRAALAPASPASPSTPLTTALAGTSAAADREFMPCASRASRSEASGSQGAGADGSARAPLLAQTPFAPRVSATLGEPRWEPSAAGRHPPEWGAGTGDCRQASHRISSRPYTQDGRGPLGQKKT